MKALESRDDNSAKKAGKMRALATLALTLALAACLPSTAVRPIDHEVKIESTPLIGQIFGSSEVLAVLPSGATTEGRERYRQLIASWRSDRHSIEVVLDAELDQIPADRSLWVLGGENRLARTLFSSREVPGLMVGLGRVRIEQQMLPAANHSLVVVRRHPDNAEEAIGWLVIEPDAAFAGMGRKLPQYGEYSYLMFEGEEPTNVLKGRWTSSGSSVGSEVPPASRDRPAAPPQRTGRPFRLGAVPAIGHIGPGVKISATATGSPAEAAGLRPDDVLTHIDGRLLENVRHFLAVLGTLEAGKEISLTILRGEEEITLQVTPPVPEPENSADPTD